jgi:hypothetical protein
LKKNPKNRQKTQKLGINLAEEKLKSNPKNWQKFSNFRILFENSPENSQSMDVRYKVGIGLLTLVMLLGSLATVLTLTRGTESAFLTAAPSLLRARRSANENDGKLKFEPVVRHHVVHTEVNSHIGLENFLKIAAEKKSEEEQEIPEDSSNSPESPESSEPLPEETPEVAPEVPEETPEVPEKELNQEPINQSNSEMNRLMIEPKQNLEIMLPSFDICPIGPELPGESGSIRKVRDTERAKVDRRISGKDQFGLPL